MAISSSEMLSPASVAWPVVRINWPKRLTHIGAAMLDRCQEKKPTTVIQPGFCSYRQS
jgi:hypothetical protein